MARARRSKQGQVNAGESHAIGRALPDVCPLCKPGQKIIYSSADLR